MLGLHEGASENKEVAKALLEDLVERGLSPERRRLFVIDGSKVLRRTIDAVFRGTESGASMNWLSRRKGVRVPCSEPPLTFNWRRDIPKEMDAAVARNSTAFGAIPLQNY